MHMKVLAYCGYYNGTIYYISLLNSVPKNKRLYSKMSPGRFFPFQIREEGCFC